MDAPQGRVPPSDLDCEAAVLSACLLEASAYDQVQLILQPKHFYADANRRIFEAIVELHTTGNVVDIVSVASWLRSREKIDQIGGTPYLAQLSDATPAVAHVAHHAQVIVDKWSVRQVISACTVTSVEAYGDIGTVPEWLQEVDGRVYAVTRRETADKNISLLGAAAADETKRVGELMVNKGAIVSGIPTGLPTLDARIRGMHRGLKYTVAARPRVGKTAFALGAAIAAARSNTGVIFCSLEMPRDQLALRALSQESNIDSQKLGRGQITQVQFTELTSACHELANLPLVIFDKSTQTVSSIRSCIREGRRVLRDRWGSEMDVGLVVTDFLQIMDPGAHRTGNEVTDLANITLGTAQLAKDENIALMELSQLNRALEKRPRDERRPTLPDLRGAGQIEENTHTIIFLYRDDVYKKDGEDRDNNAEIIVAKDRSGIEGTVHVKFKPKTTTFYEKSRNPDYEQLGDIFDDYIPGQSGEPFANAPHWNSDD